MKQYLLIFLWLLIGDQLIGQGTLQGIVTDEHDDPLPYATLYINNLAQGTACNEEGRYSMDIPRGTHRILFQFLGYATVERTIEIGHEVKTLNIQLFPEAIELETIEVGADNEDPAYSIMRRAIAKAKFHTQQIDEYTATTYIKGSGRLKDVPRLFRKRIMKELEDTGMDTTTAFVQESVNEIRYKRPDQFEEKVISIRKIGEDNNTSPNNFVNSSFYSPEVSGSVSPLSPKAFAYYRFEYLGFFADRAYTINKIKVTPRSRGDQVFEGVIYIVEDLWSIHSLELFTYLWGIKFNINQIYEPIEENVWLPVNQIFDVTGSVFGFDFEYNYFANISDYQITLNPDLVFVPEVIDEKIEKESASEADEVFKTQETGSALETLSQGEEISRKQLRKLLREYEKEEMQAARQDTLENVTTIVNYEVDSTAYDRDSIYWTKLRPLPLTEYEVKGYKVMDSISVAENEKAEEEANDTLTVTFGSSSGLERSGVAKNFHISDLLLGGTYSISEKWKWGWHSILTSLHYNTAEGYHLAYRPYLYNVNSGLKWRLDPALHYSFGRNFWNWKVLNTFSWGQQKRLNTLTFEGGNYTYQLDEEHGIDPSINDLMTFFFEKNFLKPHQKAFGKLSITKRFNDLFTVDVSGEYARRTMLYNTSFNKIFDSKKRDFTSNQPWNAELGPTDFEPYSVAIGQFRLSAKPWLKYQIRNGKKRVIDNSSPELTFTYRTGLAEIEGSLPSFHHIDLGYKHVFDWGIRGQMSLQINGGTFFNAQDLRIAELKHFPTNPTFLTTLDPVKSFRMLIPYTYSTQKTYLETHVHYQFRKFLLTQFPLVRLTGIRENIFVNSLETQASNHYVELGYGINYIFRLFRIEVVTSYQDFKFQDWGIRIGIASNLDTLFD